MLFVLFFKYFELYFFVGEGEFHIFTMSKIISGQVLDPIRGSMGSLPNFEDQLVFRDTSKATS